MQQSSTDGAQQYQPYAGFVSANQSFFDGGLLTYFLYWLAAFVLTTITLGLALPWAYCLLVEWKTTHTVIEGRRLAFSGSGLSLLGHWLLWWFLCLITLGIYSFWVFIALERWKIANTRFA